MPFEQFFASGCAQVFWQHRPVVMLNEVKHLDRGGQRTLFPFPTQILRDAQDDRVIAGPCHTEHGALPEELVTPLRPGSVRWPRR